MSGDVYKQDIASGINFKGKGLRTILDRVHEGLVSGVVVMRKDRLSRFATDLLEHFFRKAGIKFVVHCANEDLEGPTELAITTVFVASNNGKRSAQNRRSASQKRSAEESEVGTGT
ncbi:MAG: recombinase family protein [Gammaproteobacteria bacterium]|nr:recombinase family protein [Gammaproteobacteria bacterium]